MLAHAARDLKYRAACGAALPFQVDSYESDGEELVEDQDVDIYAPLFASVLKELHRVVFMYEVRQCSQVSA